MTKLNWDSSGTTKSILKVNPLPKGFAQQVTLGPFSPGKKVYFGIRAKDFVANPSKALAGCGPVTIKK